jgi:hypothetical protein
MQIVAVSDMQFVVVQKNNVTTIDPIQKSKEVKVAFIFSYFRCSIVSVCVVVAIKSNVATTLKDITLNRKLAKITDTFALVDLLTFE